MNYKTKYYNKVFIIGILLSMFLLLSCSDDNPVSPDDNTYSSLLDNVVFVPNSGPPGTPVELQNLATLPDVGFWSLNIGDETVPIIKTDSSYYTIIPLIFSASDSTWPIASVSPLDVTLILDSNSVDTAFGKITVDSLAHAEGAVDSLIQDFLHASDAIRDISLALGLDDTLLQAVCMAMDEIIVSGDNSLSAIIHGTSPIVDSDSLPIDLFSALLVSTGVSDMVSSWSDSLQVVQADASKYQNRQKSLVSIVDDEGLAYRMQMYSLLSGFSSQVIGQTALTWNKFSAVLGVAGIAFPPLGFIEFIVSFVVAELDFIFNKIALALLPAQITDFKLGFLNHEINTGDTTEAIVYISAKNNPPNITPLDIVTQVINGMALADWIHNLGSARRFLPADFHEIVEGLTTWYLGVINNVLGVYFNAPTMMDVSLPEIRYDSVLIYNPGLIDLISPNLSKIEPMSGSINGRAKDSTGKIGLMVTTQTSGPHTLIHPILASAGYAGGAFGDEYKTSNIDTVTVVADLALEVNFGNTITVGGANLLGVHAGYYTSDGNPRWADGVQINLSVSGGSASSTSGVTDASGFYSSMITIDSTADSVVVHVFAYGDYNSQHDTTVVARTDRDSSSINGVTFRGTFWAIAQADSIYRKSEWYQQDFLQSSDSLEKNMNANYSLSNSFPGGSANASISFDCNLRSDSTDGIITMTETFSMSNSAAYSVGEEGYSNAGVVTSYYNIDGAFWFDVTGNALVTVEYSSGPASGFDLNQIACEGVSIPSNGSWQSVFGDGTHIISFHQVHSFMKSIPPYQDSYSDQSTASGTLTVTIEPQ